MEERFATLENAYFYNVLDFIDAYLKSLPDPAYEYDSLERKSITRYRVREPDIGETKHKNGKLITVNYSKMVITQYGIIAGPSLEKDPMRFECFEGSDGKNVVVRGFYSDNEESREWLKPIFDGIWQKLLENFPD